MISLTEKPLIDRDQITFVAPTLLILLLESREKAGSSGFQDSDLRTREHDMTDFQGLLLRLVELAQELDVTWTLQKTDLARSIAGKEYATGI